MCYKNAYNCWKPETVNWTVCLKMSSKSSGGGAITLVGIEFFFDEDCDEASAG